MSTAHEYERFMARERMRVRVLRRLNEDSRRAYDSGDLNRMHWLEDEFDRVLQMPH